MTHEQFLKEFCGYDSIIGIPVNKYFFAYQKLTDTVCSSPSKFKSWFIQQVAISEENFHLIDSDGFSILYGSALNHRVFVAWLIGQKYYE